MTIKQLEETWRQNFKNSPLIVNKKFNPLIARQIYYGPSENCLPFFQTGFRFFCEKIDQNETENNIDKFLDYLKFIGINISKDAILQHIEAKNNTFEELLKKASYIFKNLAKYDESLDIEDPFHDNKGDILLFLKIEIGSFNEQDQISAFEELDLPNFYKNHVQLPKGYENSKVANQLFELIEDSNKSIFLTGKAGTGKSTFLHYFKQKTNKNILLVASTGIAAINIGGQTIHSFFKFPLKPLLPNDPDIPIFAPYSDNRKIIEQTDTIIIDEVSMLRADVLQGLDYSLRVNGGDPDSTFGGKQLVFVGDIFQLPPVVDRNNEVENELFESLYQSEYFFDCPAYKALRPTVFEFGLVHRQSNRQFIRLLNDVRDCSLSIEAVEELNKRYLPNYKPSPTDFVITLTTTNSLAKAENRIKISKLPYKSYFSNAEIMGDFKKDKYPNDPILELKKHSQVMFLKNDSSDGRRRWVNGTIARVEYVDEKLLLVKLKDGSVHELKKEIWENRQYQWDKKKNRITSKVIGTYEQYPVKLAWSITIHKSQGLTFDNVIIDLGSGAFINGQLYTALSRCKSLDGIILKKQIKIADAVADPRLLAFNYSNQLNIFKTLVLFDWNFFLKYISLYYPFTEEQLESYFDYLPKGDPFYSVFNADTENIIEPDYGLCFNENVIWPEKFIKKYQIPYWWWNDFHEFVYQGGGTDESLPNYNLDMIDNHTLSLIPLSLAREIQDYGRSWEKQARVLRYPQEYYDLENISDEEYANIYFFSESDFTDEYPQLPLNKLIDLYFNRSDIFLLNRSIWNNSLKNLFDNNLVDTLINKAKEAVKYSENCQQ